MQQNQMFVKRAATVLAIGAILGLATGAATAGTVKVRKNLTATSADTNARGKTDLSLTGGAKGKFDVKASHLTPDSSFDVVVRGVKVGTLNTGHSGSGKVRFSTRPGARDVALGFDPRGSTIDVRDDSGDDVLVGDIPSDSVDPAEVACCLTPSSSGENEVDCEDLTADGCGAAGGTVQTVASCLPDPCGNSPVPETAIVCCTNQTGDDGSASECEDRSEAECAAAGGTVVQATSCDPNPCAPTPPTTETACCVPDSSGSGEIDCEVTTPEACTALQGTAASGSTCSTDPCGTGSSASGSGSDDSGNGGSGN
jgi:hypothetical protein